LPYFIRQQPLTEEDVKLYIEILPETARLLGNGPFLSTIKDTKKQLAYKLFKKFNTDRGRFSFIQIKIQICLYMISGVNFDFSQTLDVLKITNSDIEIVKKYKKEIIAAHELFFINRMSLDLLK
jgi:hypothetical protein